MCCCIARFASALTLLLFSRANFFIAGMTAFSILICMVDDFHKQPHLSTIAPAPSVARTPSRPLARFPRGKPEAADGWRTPTNAIRSPPRP